jgi:hypothetical protein
MADTGLAVISSAIAIDLPHHSRSVVALIEAWLLPPAESASIEPPVGVLIRINL